MKTIRTVLQYRLAIRHGIATYHDTIYLTQKPPRRRLVKRVYLTKRAAT